MHFARVMFTYTRSLEDLHLEDASLVGSKTALLGEMLGALRPTGIEVPDGFAITADAYRAVLEQARVSPLLAEVVAGLDRGDVKVLANRARRARASIRDAGVPGPVWKEIEQRYRELCERYDADVDVAVRCSATAEDLPTASFAGQREGFLNVRGLAALREAVGHCFASLFTERALSYRLHHGLGHRDLALSIAVQKMVRSDLASAGVMFTLDAETGFRDVVTIEAALGLGENVVKGNVDPDEFCVFKPTLRDGKRPILRRRVGEKHLRMVYAEGVSAQATRSEPVPERDRQRLCVSDDEVLTLARCALNIEDHYSRLVGERHPMEIEWAKDGRTGQLFVLRVRPEKVEARCGAAMTETFVLEGRGEELAIGRHIGRKIAGGPARVVRDVAELDALQPGEILVVDTTTPDWEPIMKRAAAIVTDRGGRTCHAAIVARELDIPAIVGTGNGTQRIGNARPVTVSCAGGDAGRVFAGTLPYRIDQVDVKELPPTRTRIEMNVSDPEQAFVLATSIPSDGVGLARIELIMTNAIRIHPMALLHAERLVPEDRRAVDAITVGYDDKAAYFVDRLMEGVGMIAAAFYPKPVVVRLSNLKSSDYATLVGGEAFEAHEENPMIGLRGASRYTHESYAEAFALECEALARVRGEMGLDNVRVMVPFCRRVEEGERVLAAMARHGLVRGEQGLVVYVMCEIPNNVMCIDEFCRIFDGISIESDNLTQLALGVDRHSELAAFDFDERDPGVLELLRRAVTGARRNRKHVGSCGQAPSDYPEIAELLVRLGIDALSLDPDAVVAARLRMADVERALGVRVHDNATTVTTGPRAPLTSIVVGIDPSPHSRQALDRAVRIPLQMGASLDLVYVVDGERSPETVAEREGEARQLLEDARASAQRLLPSSGTHDVVTSFAWGTPFAVIADRAHHSRADLVVVGRHGERRFRDLVIGSTTERVIRKGSVSVLVVAAPPETTYRRPLVAVDMSDSSRLALQLAARICDPNLDAIDVVHVISVPSRLHVGGGELVPSLERRRDELEQSVREQLLTFLAAVDAGVRWNVTVKCGEPREVILDEARQRRADLLALGTKGRTGLARVLLGSVAEGVIRGAGCDVLVARLPEVRR